MQQSASEKPAVVLNLTILKTFFALAIFFYVSVAQAAETGHFGAGVLNIRDFIVPQPGFYSSVYNYGYMSDRLNDAAGNSVNSVTIHRNQGPSVTLGINKEVNNYVLAPSLVWITPWKILGARFGGLISPTFKNTSLGTSLSTVTGSGRRAEESQFGVGDMFVQPVWLGWTLQHWDFGFGYGFYAPIGKYGTETFNLPVVGSSKVEATDNIGLGFWSHQLQGMVTFYPWIDKQLAIVTALTYEFHHNKNDFDLTPGQDITLNWGLSQYIPLQKSKELMLEFGPRGYSTWQTTNDSGSDAAQPYVKDELHAAGGQIGLRYLPWNNAALNFIYQYEFASEDRFQGQSFGLNFAIKIL